jgi:hypothetical protein
VIVQQGIHALDMRPGRVRTPRLARSTVLTLALVAAAVAAAGVIAIASSGQSASGSTVRVRQPKSVTSVLTGSPAAVSAGAARMLLASAPAAVVADAGSRAEVAVAASDARRAHAPLLLTSASDIGTAQTTALRGAVKALAPRVVLAVGVGSHALAAELPGVSIVTTASALPATGAAVPLRHVAVLVHPGPSAASSALAIAAATTAQAAGAQVIELPGYDPRADPTAIRTLAAAKPQHVLGIGSGFGTARLLASRIAVAETGAQLPGGGQVLFPMRRIVALYGSPGTPALGALGQQDLVASISRVRQVAAQYSALSTVPVIPAFEIIATVAQGSPGSARTYSYESSVASLRPWVIAAAKAGLYVTLDLQPGRANLLTQAKRYRSLLKLPNVGLALDPEWKLQPGQLPLHQIGSVSITEVNSVVSWLARLTARYRLPQKLLELHEFRLTMIQDVQRLDTRHDDLAIVINMDGQGAPTTKRQTWRAVIAGAPTGVFFGWKDFYVKDTPMLGPRQTMNHFPQPVLISYQ